MRRSKYRRASSKANWFSGRRRIIAVAATLVAFGGIVTVTQVSNAATNRTQKKALAACNNIQAPAAAKLSTLTKRQDYTTNGGKVIQHPDDGAGATVSATTLRTRCRNWVMQNTGGQGGGGGNATAAPSSAAVDPSAGDAGNGNAGNGNAGNGNAGNGNAGNGNNGGGNNGGGQTSAAPAPTSTATAPPAGAGLDILANNCDNSQLQPHTGFQDGNRCVTTEFGEVGSQENKPSLLITQAPTQVNVNTAFTLVVSTRNLIRDRFLAAGAGGYYVESSVLQNGIVRGHFHTACRMLASTNEAPDPAAVPAFFVATEDKQGSATPDSVTIQVPGLPTAGTAQCASWAGDGSHRIPMMQRANQTPALDAVRIQVGNAGGGNAGGGNAGNAGGGNAGANNGGRRGN